MIITSIELVGFKRMMLANITRFALAPQERIQLVLGTNGCGKSSLLGELSPMPAIAANYTKEGSKTITLHHRGINYTLRSVFSPRQEHSFMKEREELNQGGTLTAQKELVEKEFGVRQDIHDMLSGLVRFSDMSPSVRRQWFTQMCENNYDYALSVFGRLKDSHRDCTGALKLAKKRLVVEMSKTASAAEIEKIQTQITALVAEIDQLYNCRVDESRSVLEITASLDKQEKELSSLSVRLIQLSKLLSVATHLSPEELTVEIDAVKHQITSHTTRSGILAKEHSELKTAQETFLKAEAYGVDELKDKLHSLQNVRNEVLSGRKLGLEFMDVKGANAALESVYEVLVSTFSALPSNEDRRYSQVSLATARDKLQIVKEKMHSAERRMETLRHQKQHYDHLKGQGDTECPKCTFRWVPGLDPSKYTTIESSMEEGVVVLREYAAEKLALEAIVEENVQYGDLFKEFARATRTLPVLAPFWELLNDDNIVYRAPSKALTMVELLRRDLELACKANELETEAVKVRDMIELAVRASNIDAVKVNTRLEEVDASLGHLAQTTHALNKALLANTQQLQRMNEMLGMEERIRQQYRLVENGVTDLVRATKNEIVNDCLRTLQIELAQKQNTLNDIRMQKGIVADIEANLTKLELEEEAIKHVLTSLSPSDGLIAEGLLGFIRSFIRKMNAVIKKIWAYRMEVLDCAVDGDGVVELDYYFPILVNSKDNIVPDVGKGSEGMKAVVDLAFRVVAMDYLGMGEFPLILDEPAAAFDAEHARAFGRTLNDFISQMSFSQIYLVSHDYAQYASLVQSEVCVIDPTNIVVPGRYNEHVTIE